MSMFVLTSSWEFPALPLLDEFIGDGIANEKGGVNVVGVEEVKDVAPVKSSSLGDGVRIFENEQFGSIRTSGTWEKPLFCLIDVARGLGYSNPAKAVIDHCQSKGVTILETPTKGGVQKLKYGDEGQVYRLILRAKTDFAEKFQDWVTDDVLPSIRKTGSYSMDKPSYECEDRIERATRWIEEEKVRQALMLENKEQKKQLEESNKEIVALSSTITQMQPKVTYYDTILANKSTVKVSQIAQDYGMSAVAFNKLLWEHKLQRKVGKQWILYRQFLDKGYVHSEPIPIEHHDGSQTYNYLTVWTQKGRIFLYNFLKGFGVLPMIERSDSDVAHK